ncbi:hypothetical protein [Mucisphaera sp.]|uniref:hypothetical protein n=1 Tax=Mucisphaera sp. TaxID=2913024 RepID=UPI003D1062B3
MRTATTLATAAIATLSLTSRSLALEVEIRSKPTPGLLGFTTYTLALVGDGEFNAMKIDIQAIRGELNQEIRFGQRGLFADDGIFQFVPETKETDTYFLFDRPSLLVDGETGETDTQLLATFAFSENQSTPFPLAQVVVRDSTSQFDLFVQGGVGENANNVIFDGFTLVIPSPTGDANADFTFNQADIDTIYALRGSLAFPFDADVDQDGEITDADVLGALQINNHVFADINFDRTVGMDDLSILAANFQQPGGYADGDINGDAFVDLIDLSLLASNYSNSTIPEPTLALLSLGILFSIARTSRC